VGVGRDDIPRDAIPTRWSGDFGVMTRVRPSDESAEALAIFMAAMPGIAAIVRSALRRLASASR
jgi:hypothetical protein